MSSNDSQPKVALVIGAGALKCAAAFGVVKVLVREQIGSPAIIVVGEAIPPAAPLPSALPKKVLSPA